MKRSSQQISQSTSHFTDLEFTVDDLRAMDEAVAKHKELKKTPITTQPITQSVERSVEKSVEKSASSSESLEYSEIYLFTDGSCLGNPGPGGYGALIQYKNSGKVVREKEVSGSEADTTNNRMEISAAVKALEALSNDTKTTIHLHTDSKYVKDGINSWMANWKKNGWRTANKKPVKNQDLWMQLDSLVSKFKIEWHWVKGHSGHPENERVDVLARTQAESVQKTRKF